MITAPTLEAGARIAERYEVERELGRGGMGIVYLVRDTHLGEVVALKVLFLEHAPADAVERFRREVRLARRITHPNVARIHDIGETELVEGTPCHFLTMEYVDGRGLDTLIDGPTGPRRVVSIGSAIARGLAAAHAAEVVHRDLKPANVLVERSGRVVLTDFGIACAVDHDDGLTQQSGVVVGTPRYMAPEQVLGEAIDGRADLYALGLVLYELLTGELPFEAETGLASALARVRNAPKALDAYPDVPAGLAAIVMKLLAREPGERYADAKEVAEALERWETVSAPTAAMPISSLRAFESGAPRGGPLGSWAPGPPTSSVPTPPSHGASGPPTPTSTSGISRLARTSLSIAVMPFRYRGPAEEDHLGDGISEELIDVLTRTRGLRVLAFGATTAVTDDGDPQAVGRQLGVDAIVTGKVQLSSGRVRVVARLIEVDSGVQAWTERFDGTVEDLFELEEQLARRIAEALRVQLDATHHGAGAPSEAIELYMRGRRQLREQMYSGAGGAVELLERCIALAPAFAPALSAHAIAAVRAWWQQLRDDSRDWQAESEQSVARALEHAPDRAETHLAAAMATIQTGDLAATARSLSRALEIAPTFAEAHAYLGDLQTEAGRLREGQRRLTLALELDPTLIAARFPLARIAALHGDWEAFDAALDKLKEREGTLTVPLMLINMRTAAWRGDEARMRELTRVAESADGDLVLQALSQIGHYTLGELEPDVMDGIEALAPAFKNPRLISLVGQIACEAHALRGFADRAMASLERAADNTLIDLEWMDRCVALASLRDRDDFADARRKVERRAQGIWEAKR